MSKEIKCPSCGKWNSGTNTNCVHCSSILDSTTFYKTERQKREPVVVTKPKKPTWLDKFLERTQNSKNPFVIATRTFLYYTWMVYFAIVMFFTWITIYTAG